MNRCSRLQITPHPRSSAPPTSNPHPHRRMRPCILIQMTCLRALWQRSCWSSRYGLARPIWHPSAFSGEQRRCWEGGPARGTDVPVKRVELAPTRHPLGMLIKAKVLHICGNLHSFFFSASLTSASSQQILHFILRRLGMGCRRRGRGGGASCCLRSYF